MKYKHCVAVIVSLLFLGVGLGTSYAQILPNPMKGRSVGLYFSKKGFHFSSDYNQAFAAFLQHEDTLDLTDESLKTATSIAFGNFLCKSFEQQLGAHEAIYLNANPQLAKIAIQAIKPEGIQMRSLKPALPPQMQYLLCVEKLNCTVRNAPTLATYSNHLYALKRKVREADLILKLYDVRSEQMVGSVKIHYSDDNPPPALRYISTEEARTGASSWFTRVFDAGFTLLFDNMQE